MNTNNVRDLINIQSTDQFEPWAKTKWYINLDFAKKMPTKNKLGINKQL